MNEVKLRDRRKPGHCWQDNELYDAFAPVIGPHAVLVYVQMTRNCYGTEIRSSSRELARDSGLSKDTVLRALRVMERVGMLRVAGGGPRTVAEYHLADLKELAEHHGGTFDYRRRSYIFSDVLTARLRVLVAGTSGAGSDSPDAGVQKVPGGPVACASGAGGDSSGEAAGAVSDSGTGATPSAAGPVPAPALALQKPTSGAGDGHVSFSAFQNTRQQDNPPPTPAPAGVCISTEMELQARIGNLRQRMKAEKCGSPKYFELAFELQELDRAAPEVPRQVLRAVATNVATVPAPPAESTLYELAAWVMAECGFTEEGARKPILQPALRRVVAMAEPGARPMRAAAMAAAWHEYTRGPARWGPKQFFTLGHWQQPASWPRDGRVFDPCAPGANAVRAGAMA